MTEPLAQSRRVYGLFPAVKRGSLAAVLSLLAFLALLPSCSRQPRYAAPPVSGTEIVIDIASLPWETPRYYTVMVGAKPVSFFVIRYQDKVLSYFDACANCYQRKMGYGYEKGFVVCRSCGTTYSIYKLDKGLGGCYPFALSGTVQNGTYRIPIASVEARAAKF